MATDTLSRTLSALADPTRRAILSRLGRGTATVKELAAPFDLSAPAVTKHLQVLERAELIERGRRAQWRPCTLRPEPLREASEWVGAFRELWEARFARLDDVLADLQNEPTPRRTDKRTRK
ncbi:MAG: winged helix-turn-helix transcriptional regulator [Planctomycetes bacterium]|nr:winged helix-turn-helix transcriptional regulator [Planctomycetota bacterium]MCB9886994.1 winged helix-turn-helix transcriptional regulator [Planctomycetota bacterium]